jgi:hypothetical protein
MICKFNQFLFGLKKWNTGGKEKRKGKVKNIHEE